MLPDFHHRRHKDSLISALKGLITAFSSQPNFKIMILASICVINAGFILGISSFEWMIIILIVGLVFLAEMINTAIEAVVDLVTVEWRENAKIAKDVSGGMVLLTVLVSMIIGAFIFVPKFL